MLLSVIVPVYNEGASLGALLKSLDEALVCYAPGHFEVIIVDDGSDAVTKQALCDPPPGFRVITLSKRGGSGAARRLASRQARGGLCAWIDGDSTYGADDLIRLAQGIGTADQVVGCRGTDNGRCLWLRHLMKRSVCVMVSVIWRTRIPDLNSGLRVFKNQSMQRWLHEVPDGFSCTSTATLAALNHDQQVVFQAITYYPRPSETRSKFHPFYDTWRMLRVILRQACRRWTGRPDAKSTSASMAPIPEESPKC